ncbi:MAG: hypothetical protein U1E36_03390 [Rickettsiales bacterium]
MLILLIAGGITGVFTLTQSVLRYDGPSHDWAAWMQGVAARKVEGDFEKSLPFRDAAIQTWTAFTSSVFHTASKDIHIGKDGWYYTTEELQYYPDGADNYARKIGLISDVQHYLERYDIPLVVLLLPAKARIYPEHLRAIDFPVGKQQIYKKALNALHAKGIIAPDLLPVYESYKAEGGLVYLRTDTHWTPEMAEKVANTLPKTLSDYLPGVQLPKTGFTTITKKSEPFLGDLPKRMVPTGLFQPFVGPFGEIITPHVTTKLDEGEAGLFEETQVPVTLLGTSYSADPKWNFEGAIKTALQSDVLNLAEKGRGPIYPLEQFFKTTDFINAPPKLVIWEIPERSLEVPYDFNVEAPHAMKAINEMQTKEYP